MKMTKTKPVSKSLQNTCWIILISLFSLPSFAQKSPIDEIANILNQHESYIATDGIFQGFLDENKTKFIGAFIQPSNLNETGDLKKKRDKNTRIIIKDFSEVPNILGYIVVGLKYESKWYFEKSQVTYFTANNLELGKTFFLELVDFPKEKSIKKASNFWETGYFEKEKKVPYSLNPEEEKRLKKLARKEKNESYKNTYLEIIRDLRKESYLGYYKIVANRLRKEKKAEIDSFKMTFGANVLQVFFDDFIKKNASQISQYEKMGFGFPIILSPQKNFIICPILLVYQDGSSKVHYFLFMLNNKGEYEYFEWTFFPARKPKYSAAYSANAFDDLNTITVWNYSFDYLKDQKFWDEKVLKKEGNTYRYLKKVD